MDNLRKTNIAFGEIISDVNKEVTDDELDSLLSVTAGDFIDMLTLIPEQLRKLTIGDFMDIIVSHDDDEAMEELCDRIGFGDDDMTEEEEAKFNEEFGAFERAFNAIFKIQEETP